MRLPAPTPADIDAVARTLWGEARDDGHEGMVAVACVIRNRMLHPRWWGGPSAESVCRKPWQFSCWNENSPELAAVKAVTDADQQFKDALAIAKVVMNTGFSDVTNGADSYYATTMTEPPSWAKGIQPCARIGRHLFFRTEI